MKKICLLIVAFCLVLLTGCAPQNDASQSGSSSGAYAVVTDDRGTVVTLAQKPQRVVVLSTSLLNFAAAVDGDLAGRATVKAEDASLPEKYQHVPDVGPVYNVSLEKVLACQPDLVIASADHHEKLAAQLEESHIPVLVLKTKTYDDVKRNLEVIGKVYGKEEAAKAKEDELDQAVHAVTDAVPAQGKRVAILHVTPSSVSAELPSSIAGDMADLLHLKNIAADAAGDGQTTRIPYSMESLVQADPDVIFLTSMGSSDKIEKRIREDIQGNPAWASLTAVKAGQVYVLPEKYFLLNPGLDYPKAVTYMARLAQRYQQIGGELLQPRRSLRCQLHRGVGLHLIKILHLSALCRLGDPLRRAVFHEKRVRHQHQPLAAHPRQRRNRTGAGIDRGLTLKLLHKYAPPFQR